ncbi:hypothetical protein TNCV_1891051 [Trichonephila clavipes]|nr:hypothetical protein TNCV_1891051 [Trichonephila clavipes]
MKVSGAIKIFQCLESLHGLRYTKFLGDGNSKVYKAVNEMLPYEDTDISPGYYTTRAMEVADRERLRKANYDNLQKSKEARVKRHKKYILEDNFVG